MVDLSNFIELVFLKLRTMPVNQGVSVLTFKKDRQVSVLKNINDYDVIEAGFYHEIFLGLEEKAVRKLLKSMVKKEFPRSNKLHLLLIQRDAECLLSK